MLRINSLYFLSTERAPLFCSIISFVMKLLYRCVFLIHSDAKHDPTQLATCIPAGIIPIEQTKERLLSVNSQRQYLSITAVYQVTPTLSIPCRFVSGGSTSSSSSSSSSMRVTRACKNRSYNFKCCGKRRRRRILMKGLHARCSCRF